MCIGVSCYVSRDYLAINKLEVCSLSILPLKVKSSIYYLIHSYLHKLDGVIFNERHNSRCY